MRDQTWKHTHEHHAREHHAPHNRHHAEVRPHTERRHHPEAGSDKEQGPHDGPHRGRFGGHGGGHGDRPGGHGGGRFGGPRGRARRGEARFILLDALQDGPKHGYEIIKSLEDRSGGQYAPSPGTVYPTMQYLEDMGLVRASQETERRVFSLTDAGRADLEAHAQDIADFWERFASTAASPADQAESGFLREDLEALNRTVWDGLHGPLSAGGLEAVRQVRAALTRCRTEIREIIAAGQTAASAEGEREN